MTGKEILEQHRKAGDLIKFCTEEWYENKSDEKWDFCKKNCTDSEFSEFKKSARSYVEKIYEEQCKNGNSEKWLTELAFRIKKAFNWIVEDYLVVDFKKRYSEEIPLHREKGDLVDYLWEETDKYNYDCDGFCSESLINNSLNSISFFCEYEEFSVEYSIINPLLTEPEQIEIYNFFWLFLGIKHTKEFSYLKAGKNDFKILFDLYTSPSDSIKYKRFQKLRSRVGNAEGGRRLDMLLEFVKELNEQKKNGDPIWYVVDYVQKNKLDYNVIQSNEGKIEEYLEKNNKSSLKKESTGYYNFDKSKFSQNYPIQAYVRDTFLESDINEIYDIFENVFYGDIFGDHSVFVHVQDTRGYKYLRELSKSKRGSVRYERYLKIRNELGENLCIRLDKKLFKHNLKFIVHYIVPCLFLVLLLAMCVVNTNKDIKELEQQRTANEAAGLGRYTNDELAQQEKERQKAEEKALEDARLQNKIRQEQIEKDKKEALNKKQDLINQDKVLLSNTNKVSDAKNIAMTDYLKKIQEPRLFVVAPMSYDVSNFPKENLPILDEAILKFENQIDEMSGFSFIDRSQIEQIEKEHKFQLSDWSNDTKTAEIGKSLNANILLFLDKFSYIKDEYRFQARFLDVNTMQISTLLLSYKEKTKQVAIETGKFNPKDFTQISTAKNPFGDELNLTIVKKFRIPQNSLLSFGDKQNACPLGSYQKLDLSEYDEFMPKTLLLNVSSINVDGFGGVELKIGNAIEKGTYSFEPCEMYFEKIGDDFYSDGKIGSLSIHTEKIYEKCDVFTQNNKEYFLKIGSAKPDSVFINYYLQTVKQ